MPHLPVGDGVQLWYEVRGQSPAQEKAAQGVDPPLLALLDNRGVGRTTSPASLRAYTTELMAQDCLHLMDHLGWLQVHVVGHSMGGMIALKLAALAPERMASLTLISVTGGRWQALPSSPRTLYYFWQMLCAKTIEDRASVDLKLHFTAASLDEPDSSRCSTRRELLHEEYVEGQRSGGIGQPAAGFRGQIYCVWQHRLTARDAAAIRRCSSSGTPVLFIHGRRDILAAPRHGERLARRLAAPCVMLEAAHFVTREAGPEVNLLLQHMIYRQRAAHARARMYLTCHAQESESHDSVADQRIQTGK